MMARAITYAIRLILRDGKAVLARESGQIGRGRVATFRTRAAAEYEANLIRGRRMATDVTVIERSHGRQSPAVGRVTDAGEQATSPAPETKNIHEGSHDH